MTSLICEKRSNQNQHQCQDNQFRCHDGTYVLLIYMCDFINDCFAGSDEDVCGSDNTSIVSYNVLSLPCLLFTSCNDLDTTRVPIHSICDGIYTNTSLYNEKHLCYNNPLKHVNLNITLVSTILGRMVGYVQGFKETHFEDNVTEYATVLQKQRARCSNNAPKTVH